jgi:hypothetical protein
MGLRLTKEGLSHSLNATSIEAAVCARGAGRVSARPNDAAQSCAGGDGGPPASARGGQRRRDGGRGCVLRKAPPGVQAVTTSKYDRVCETTSTNAPQAVRRCHSDRPSASTCSSRAPVIRAAAPGRVILIAMSPVRPAVRQLTSAHAIITHCSAHVLRLPRWRLPRSRFLRRRSSF